MEKPLCPECHSPIRGRTDKKFCSDPCRNAYHNRRNREKNRTIRNINRILRENYRILQHWGETFPQRILGRDSLLEAGFSFRAHTYSEKGPAGLSWFWVYDRGYEVLPGNRYRMLPGGPADKGEGLFPVMCREFKGRNHNILAADLADEQPVPHYG